MVRALSLEHIPALADNERSALSDYLARLHDTCGKRVMHVVLFGSKARGDSGPESDIDLFVVLRGELDGLKQALADLSYDVSLNYGVVLSDFVVGEQRYHWMAEHREPLPTEVQREGVELWKGKIFHQAFKDRQQADYSDSAEFTEVEARRMLHEAERFGGRIEEFLKNEGFID
jgi:predicted nucleotidyltransferase